MAHLHATEMSTDCRGLHTPRWLSQGRKTSCCSYSRGSQEESQCLLLTVSALGSRESSVSQLFLRCPGPKASEVFNKARVRLPARIPRSWSFGKNRRGGGEAQLFLNHEDRHLSDISPRRVHLTTPLPPPQTQTHTLAAQPHAPSIYRLPAWSTISEGKGRVLRGKLGSELFPMLSHPLFSWRWAWGWPS